VIRVKLLDRLSTVDSEKGEGFRSRVASDVFQGNNIVIPPALRSMARWLKFPAATSAATARCGCALRG